MLFVNELTIFDRKEWIDRVFGGILSTRNPKFIIFSLAQLFLVWVFLGSKSKAICEEFSSESKERHRIRGYYFRVYVVGSFVALFVFRYLLFPMNK
jgi:predicted nucleic acid-binding Zn ribbon protein